MLLMGFKSDWAGHLLDSQQYFAVIQVRIFLSWIYFSLDFFSRLHLLVLQGAFDLNLAVGILRVLSGLDFSDHFKAEETLQGEAEGEQGA